MKIRAILLSLIFMLSSMASARRAVADGVVGSGTPESCTAAAFSSVLAANSHVSFNCGPNPHVITIPVQEVISSDKTIDGGGLISIHAGLPIFANDRHFLVKEGTHLTLENIALRYGSPKNGGYGGCVYVERDARFTLLGSTIRDCFVLDAYAGGLIHNEGETSVASSELSHGQAGSGGAINSAGVLFISESMLHDNKALARVGGALSISGFTEIRDSSITANKAWFDGGGIYHLEDGELSISDTVIANNQANDDGGGLYNMGKISTLINVEFNDNEADDDGGLFHAGQYSLEMQGGGFYRNQAYVGGGARCVASDEAYCKFVQVTFEGNVGYYYGGGLRLSGNAESGDAEIVDSLFLENRVGAAYGGAVDLSGGKVNVVNSTFTGNSASEGGAFAVGRGATLSIASSTLFDNEASSGSGHAIYLFAATGNPAIMLDSMIVANNVFQANSTLCHVDGMGGDITSTGYNIDSDGSCNLVAPSDQPNTDPRLLPLAENGGPTLSLMPGHGSPAIDRGRPNCVEHDQRGFPRPVGGACDIGAVEVGSFAAVVFLPMVWN